MKKNWDYEASKVWPMLVKAASEQSTLYYQEIANEIGTNALSVGYALYPIAVYCENEGIAPLTSIVINQSTKKPGNGFLRIWGNNYQEAISLAFQKDWSLIENPFASFTTSDSIDSLSNEILSRPEKSKEVFSRIKSRGVAQQVFRKALMKAYGSRCAVCQCSLEDVLEASHIIPWAASNPEQKIDPRNGILFCSNHHKLFDKFIFTVGQEYQIIVDPEGKADKAAINDNIHLLQLDRNKLHLPESLAVWPSLEYLAVHSNSVV
ncbi:TPA: hypothetical protein I7264_26165 [Vibrio parahaemolyticus]|uniref:HNH endonuclease n=1 Tax=Vibrio parahaemolyticus TaxID=670 RepID=UPI0006A6C28F|nr:HNH endonuclease signature motif containing protein [Vibrio parahaemolyticus]EHK0843342.1 HNH endonuclease [Vibrio parahaemolyticus]EII3141974.1 HNH endonuclease [Vibrio parahaemolyticus]EJB8407318.1 HNH endonuclease [Vibrio parahaemolyticus]EJB8535538.1 HNH endonuclease [Vibrio parahaemolyticus]EJE4188926.1 HNH endonuclease [Vibrio parahaemolyticus]